MEDEIFEKIKKDKIEYSEKFIKKLNIINQDDGVSDIFEKKNIDFGIILSNLGLIENNPETSKTIDEFYEYLFKLGIECGVGMGKRILIEALQNNEVTFDEITELNPNEFTDNIYPHLIN